MITGENSTVNTITSKCGGSLGNPDPMSLKTIAERSQIDPCLIVYLEKWGLLTCSGPVLGVEKSYTVGDLKRLCFVSRTMELGFSADQVRVLLSLDAIEKTDHKSDETVAEYLDDVERKIRDLRALQFSLKQHEKMSRSGRDTSDGLIVDSLSARALNERLPR